MKAIDNLELAAKTFRERNVLWGDHYNEIGEVLAALFPDGINVRGPEQFRRFSTFLQCVNKISRYAQRLDVGGNEDSANDLCVYAAMLLEQTKEQEIEK